MIKSLFTACEEGDARVVARILREHPELDPNVTGEYDQTPLHVACTWGQLTVVQTLLRSQRVNLNCEDKFECTPLHLACLYGPDALVQFLLDDSRTSVSPMRLRGWAPLHLVCYSGHTRVMEILLANRMHRIDTSLQVEYHGCPRTAIELTREMYRSIPDQLLDDCEEMARENHLKAAIQLLEAYEQKPVQTRRQLRTKLGLSFHPNRLDLPQSEGSLSGNIFSVSSPGWCPRSALLFVQVLLLESHFFVVR